MTIDEAIRHAEEVAEKTEKKASWFLGKEGNPNYESCVKCANEHRQLAEWLEELKQLREKEPCEDAISRQQVLDIIKFEEKWLKDAKGNNTNTDIAFSSIRAQVAKLSPVTPAHKKKMESEE